MKNVSAPVDFLEDKSVSFIMAKWRHMTFVVRLYTRIINVDLMNFSFLLLLSISLFRKEMLFVKKKKKDWPYPVFKQTDFFSQTSNNILLIYFPA